MVKPPINGCGSFFVSFSSHPLNLQYRTAASYYSSCTHFLALDFKLVPSCYAICNCGKSQPVLGI